MKLSLALNVLLAASANLSVTRAESSIQEKIGSDCRNEAQFSSAFTTESGEVCTTCTFCDESDFRDVFKPKSNGVCIDCTAAEDTCANFMITTAFDSAWLMKFVSLTPSSKPTEYDPKTVVIEGSTDTSTWVELHKKEDNALFKTRSEPTELLLSNNDAEYKHYRITFKPQDNKSKYYLGHYGLFQSYTKTCASNIYEDITGHYIRPYETLAPTEAPTAKPTAQFNYNWIDEDSTDTGVLTFLTTEQVQDVQDGIIAGKTINVETDVQIFKYRDDSWEYSTFIEYLDLSSNQIKTWYAPEKGYPDWLHVKFGSSHGLAPTKLQCAKAHRADCRPFAVSSNNNVVLIRLRFNPRDGVAKNNEWRRNRFTLTGTHYKVDSE